RRGVRSRNDNPKVSWMRPQDSESSPEPEACANTATFPRVLIRSRLKSITLLPSSTTGRPSSATWPLPASTATVTKDQTSAVSTPRPLEQNSFACSTLAGTSGPITSGSPAPTWWGKTSIGRATLAVLDMNDPVVVALRQELMDQGILVP